MTYLHDLFISYATANKDVANYVVEKLEARRVRCFIAPRDITSGAEYAKEIVNAISNAKAVLLVFSEQSDQSSFVLREINSAVSRNKMVIPLRIENFMPSEAMEFYLGVTHWLDAFPEILDIHLDNIVHLVNNISCSNHTEEPLTTKIKGPAIIALDELNKIGYDNKKMVMKEIELDYLCIPVDKFNMNDEIEGTFDDWITSAIEYEEDTSALLVVEDEIVGYSDIYPVTDEAYDILIQGKEIIRDDMIALYSLGGVFNAYIAMIALPTEFASQSNYLLFFDWIIEHLKGWKSKNIRFNKIGISVYNKMLEKFVTLFGFEFRTYNPANGKVFETQISDLVKNPAIINRYGQIDL